MMADDWLRGESARLPAVDVLRQVFEQQCQERQVDVLGEWVAGSGAGVEGGSATANRIDSVAAQATNIAGLPSCPVS
jgi:hypothetical protein